MNNEFKSKDMELYETWKANPTKGNMGALMSQLHPLLQREVSSLAGSVPAEALMAEAKKHTVHAIKTYDASKGTQLSTHVYTWLQKVKRLNYTTQNAARLAENQQLKFRDYNMARQDLSTQLNRDPTDEEMSRHLGWTPKQVKKFAGELYNDLYESGSEYNPEFTKFDSNHIAWEYAKSHLTAEESRLFDTIMLAEHGPKKMSAGDIATSLGVNLNRYNYLRGNLVKKIASLQSEIGEF